MSANETIADIVAAKRREAQRLIESAEASAMCGETMAGTPYTEEDLEFARQDAKEMLAEADRIEAAYKRDIEKLNSVIQATVSRSDAEIDRLRREVAELRKQIDNVAKLREAVANSNGLLEELAAIGEWGESAREQIAENNAALAKPPRNCDVYDNESCRMAYHLHGDGIMTMQAFADWLFAPATEKEGGNDGNE